jgi:hypothetical protein
MPEPPPADLLTKIRKMIATGAGSSQLLDSFLAGGSSPVAVVVPAS